MQQIYFITSIDTDSGKSVVTGAMGRYLLSRGVNVITQKLAQTGCVGVSEDIETHRQLMQMDLTPEDVNGETCGYLFRFAASPHLSARLEGRTIDLDTITQSTRNLSRKFEVVLLEGVGGLMVPLTNDVTVIDYLCEQNYPTVLVTNGKLGSINHTLLSLEVLRRREIDVRALVYNRFVQADELIVQDTLELLKRKLKSYYPEALFVEFPECNPNDTTVVDFAALFEE